MEINQIALVTAAVLTSMVAGMLLAFELLVMPGLNALNNRDFIRSFQAIDRVVQDGQPTFGVVVLGSIVAMLAALASSLWKLAGLDRWLLVAAGLAYFLGTVMPTVAVHLRLNNRLQTCDVDTIDELGAIGVRGDFESKWNHANSVRTVFAVATATMLIVIVTRL